MGWAVLIHDATAFFVQHGAIAVELGWNVLDCFGIDPDCPERGYAAAGLVALLKGEWVVDAMHADRAELARRSNGARQIFYRSTAANGAVPVWDLAGKAIDR